MKGTCISTNNIFTDFFLCCHTTKNIDVPVASHVSHEDKCTLTRKLPNGERINRRNNIICLESYAHLH